MQFVGTFDYQLDDRKRVPIPPAYRGAFEAGGFLSTSTDPCLVLHTPDSFNRAAEIIEAIPEETEEGENARRDFYGNIWAVQKDGQGRLTLRDELIEHAGLTKDITVVGTGRRMEIWDKAAYQAREAERKAARRAATNRSHSTSGEA
jgi:MraZ protein